ncbi:hypothetical protein [Streptomyces flaveolus]|uniref:hypothetical protein n=1 Tax=Streptomyces flaveolus TaxID=67297 RepID=UPI0016714B16|nr:hypothetical protein [Streptomyces flaveolus]GGQ81194.1 hypothetical protein GCM10010216_48800 [Streptomyces flaveolus]
MRIRITLQIDTHPRTRTSRADRTPPTDDATPTGDTPPTTDATPTDEQPPFGFSLDGVSLSSDTERAEPYDDGCGAEYEDDDEHGDTQQ